MRINSCIKFVLVMTIFRPNYVQSDDQYIIVEKQGVIHKFVSFDKETDHFVKNVFQDWECCTFELFDEVKNKEGIAVDIGGWIGTTAIWLSNNFHHVVVVEPDRKSLQCLRMNLHASGCTNVSICEQAVAGTEQLVIFGPRGPSLNESISYIKDKVNNENDYAVRTITVKQLLNDYVYDNEALNSRNISFIKCDIEGGEEDILEDILLFAYNNNCLVLMSFHLDWWKSKKVADFDNLFNRFRVSCPMASVSECVTQYPFASILLGPRRARVLEGFEVACIKSWSLRDVRTGV